LDFHVIIPARYASTRLPGKPLRLIAGKPMLQHVYERASGSGAESIVVATDDERIARVAEGFGAYVCMTSAQHRSGTERLAEVLECLSISDEEIVVNLQGDEPLMPPVLLSQVASDLDTHGEAVIATLWTPITRIHELFNPHVVKVVVDRQGYALYFSRAPIPWDRTAFPVTDGMLPAGHAHCRHLGLYAYRVGFLKEFVRMPVCRLEEIEALEQLRVLFSGQKIFVAEAVEDCPPGVDTEDDLARVAAVLEA
jgi:3-deoxy-manno-octulosonate cytidylyltransferase (CMP-KDO synthetase)